MSRWARALCASIIVATIPVAASATATAEMVRSTGCERWNGGFSGGLPPQPTSEAWGGPLSLAKGEILRIRATTPPGAPASDYPAGAVKAELYMDLEAQFHSPTKLVASSSVNGPIMQWTVPADGQWDYRYRSDKSASWGFECVGREVLKPYDANGPEGTIYRLYRAYFLREPDAGGFDYWEQTYRSGYPLTAISDDFARSREFQAKYGSLSNEGFIDLAYRNVMGREADAGGRAYWLDQMRRGMPRGHVMIHFSDSPEFRSKTASGRPPGYE